MRSAEGTHCARKRLPLSCVQRHGRSGSIPAHICRHFLQANEQENGAIGGTAPKAPKPQVHALNAQAQPFLPNAAPKSSTWVNTGAMTAPTVPSTGGGCAILAVPLVSLRSCAAQQWSRPPPSGGAGPCTGHSSRYCACQMLSRVRQASRVSRSHGRAPHSHIHPTSRTHLTRRFVRRMGDTIPSIEDLPARREALARDDFTIVVSSPDRPAMRAPPAQPRVAVARSPAASPAMQRVATASVTQVPPVRGRGSSILSRLTVAKTSSATDGRGGADATPQRPAEKRVMSTVMTVGGRQLSRVQDGADSGGGGTRGGAATEPQLGSKRDRAPRVRAPDAGGGRDDRGVRGRGAAVDQMSPAGDAAGGVRAHAHGRAAGGRSEAAHGNLSALAPRKVARGGAKAEASAPAASNKPLGGGTQAEADAAALAREARFKRTADNGASASAATAADATQARGSAEADAAAAARAERFGGNGEADAAAKAREERFKARAAGPPAPQAHKRKAASPAAAAPDPASVKQARSETVRFP